MAIPPKLYQFLLAMIASLGNLLLGYDLGVIAAVVAAPSFNTHFNQPDSAEIGAVVSTFTAGAFVGAFIGGLSADRLGRRITLMMGSALFCLGGALQTAGIHLSYVISGRLIAGIGVGLLIMAVGLYQAELAHPDIRGTIVALQQFMLGIGALLAAAISYGTFVGVADNDNAQWRISLGIQIAPAAIMGCVIGFFPESPRWLIDHGQEAKGLNVLAQLHANGNESDPWVLAEFEQIKHSLGAEHEVQAKSYLDLFRSMSSFRRLLIAVALQASGQMTGVSAIQYYSVTIYGQIGISPADALKYQIINNVIALLGELTCILLIDKLGRRWPLIGGNLANAMTFIVATALLAKFPPTSNSTGAHWGFIIMTWLFNYSFSSTVGPLSWIIPAEIFDTPTRSKGVSLATMTTFAFNTLIGQITPLAMEAVGWRFYITFIVCNVTNALFFWAFLPETKKVPLEEMKELFTVTPIFVPGSSSKWGRNELRNLAESIEGGNLKVQAAALHVERTASGHDGAV
ncbi:hypothetical protein ASPCAL02676 [Aspergillus calidoustus]|uniref:Major facilitator superfamily (MFS) profile domain-containing protein n=1 Tax=Aspergillus calidoustus TaxID=454130 RepID=A0A0U5GNJ9_ASPCI|nr:hypothetical protein ASPCAL02676 [Aspergillus calidoustus]